MIRYLRTGQDLNHDSSKDPWAREKRLLAAVVGQGEVTLTSEKQSSPTWDEVRSRSRRLFPMSDDVACETIVSPEKRSCP